MADITTEVLIIGTGPAGSSLAALLATQGVKTLVVNRYRWLANSPRAHITNQRTMEVLRDLGPEVEEEAYQHATEQELMGQNVFCSSLAGEELGRLSAWGTHPLSKAEHLLSSPSLMNDLPQTFMEPLLFKTACSRGAEARMSCEYISHNQDKDGVTTTLNDRLRNETFTVRSKYLVGADGANSKVADDIGLPLVGKMGVSGSINFLFEADLTRFVAHRPSVLYWVIQPGSDVGGIGAGVVRMVRPWNQWLAIWGYDIEQGPPDLNDEDAKKIIRGLVGAPDLEIDLKEVSYWTVNNVHATRLHEGRVFCVGDAIHRHPPTNGLGSNTSIQDSFNLGWKLAAVLKGSAGAALLDTYTQERAPIAKQIVARANKSIGDYGAIFTALGITETNDPVEMQANMDARSAGTNAAAKQRADLRAAIAHKKYEYDAHGVEMNQRYTSDAIIPDETPAVESELDAELHHLQTTKPGARLPHAWVFDPSGRKISTLDLCGRGRFTLFTGNGGDAWQAAAARIAVDLGIQLDTITIGPKRDFQDHTGDWAGLCEIEDDGCLIVRPDHHVCFRALEKSKDPKHILLQAIKAIMA